MLRPMCTTGIGSLPFTDPDEACRLILSAVDIPFWPQLPALGFRERMIPQYSEGFPFAELDGENLYSVTPPTEAANAFYEALSREEGFPLTKKFAAGLEPFLEHVKEKLPVVKGQVTGPITFALGLTDRERRPAYFDEELRILVLGLLEGKARWQIRLLGEKAENVIIFIDEPILTALGSSTYVGVDPAEAGELLANLVEAIHKRDALAGIHVCGKTDWPLVLKTGIDILNFDAYQFGDSLALYPDEMGAFLSGGGRIAWGIVPTTDEIRAVDARGLKERLDGAIDRLASEGIDRDLILSRGLLTPSCGAGSLGPEGARRVFALLGELARMYA